MTDARLRFAIDPLCIGLLGPGLSDIGGLRRIVAGTAEYAPTPVDKPRPGCVASRERRRMTMTVALALEVAERSLAGASLGHDTPAVFACSGGDTEIIDRICRALLLPERPVSPGDFHNSVHNAPGGYYSIAMEAVAPTTSISAHDASFAAGLLEAATQIAAGAPRVLLVAYDTPPPPPLWRHRPVAVPFACGLILGRANSIDAAPTFDLALARDRPETRLEVPRLELLRVSNPAARSLPLLVALDRTDPEVVLPYLPGRQIVLHRRGTS